MARAALDEGRANDSRVASEGELKQSGEGGEERAEVERRGEDEGLWGRKGHLGRKHGCARRLRAGPCGACLAPTKSVRALFISCAAGSAPGSLVRHPRALRGQLICGFPLR